MAGRDNHHEFNPQFTRKTGGSRRIPLDEIGQTVMRRMRDWNECKEPQPFAVAPYQKASRAFYVLAAGRFIDSAQCKPRYVR